MSEIFVEAGAVRPTEQESYAPLPSELENRLGSEDPSRLTRLGRFVAGLPSMVNEFMLKSYIAFENDPIRTTKYGVEAGIVGAVISPANEAFRFGVAGAVQAGTGNTLAGTAAIVATTALTEGVGAVASADLLDSPNAQKIVGWLNDRLSKIVPGKIAKGKELGIAGEAALGYFGGSSVVLLAEQTINPTRTKEENRKHGLFTSGWLSCVVGMQWLAVGNAIENPTPANITAGITVGGGVIAGMKLAKAKIGSSH